ncbi:MAG: hypothetical protein IT355_07620 [Gemmatimonadaceae bacterium]|nr:hypothetical protein [Gemmatimonadaceae bacterium]
MNRTHAPTASITFQLDTTLRRRTVTFSGPIGDRELLEAFEALLVPDYDASVDDLVDLSAVTHMGVTSAGLHRLLALYEERAETGHQTRNAIIAPTDVLYGVSRMFQALHGDDKPDLLEVFRSRDDAIRWLGETAVSR